MMIHQMKAAVQSHLPQMVMWLRLGLATLQLLGIFMAAFLSGVGLGTIVLQEPLRLSAFITMTGLAITYWVMLTFLVTLFKKRMFGMISRLRLVKTQRQESAGQTLT